MLRTVSMGMLAACALACGSSTTTTTTGSTVFADWADTISDGSPIPDASATDADGDTVRLYDLASDYTVLTFHTSWCAPCAAELAWLDGDTSSGSGSSLESDFPGVRTAFGDGDVAVVVLLAEDANYEAADAADVADYQAAHGPPSATYLLADSRLTDWFEVGQYSHSVVLDDDWVVVDHGPTRMSLATLEAEL